MQNLLGVIMSSVLRIDKTLEVKPWIYIPASSLSSCVPLVKILGEGNGTPLQYSCPGNPIDGGAC